MQFFFSGLKVSHQAIQVNDGLQLVDLLFVI